MHSCPPPHLSLTLSVAPPMGLKGTPNCSGLHCWDQGVEEVGNGQTGELMEIRTFLVLLRETKH